MKVIDTDELIRLLIESRKYAGHIAKIPGFDEDGNVQFLADAAVHFRKIDEMIEKIRRAE